MKGSVKKKGSTWTYTADIGRDPKTGKRRQKMKRGFALKRDAEAALSQLLNELDKNNNQEPDKKPNKEPSEEAFSSYMEHWFSKHYQSRIKETTSYTRRYMMEKQLIRENPFANKALCHVTTEDIDTLYTQKIEEGLSPNYIRKIHQLLVQALNKAVKWKRISSNPALEAEPPKMNKKEKPIWKPDQIQTFLEACKEEKHYLTFLVAIYTGMRRGEILGLNWDDIDFSTKTINVERSLASLPGKGYTLTSLKTEHSKRRIPIPDFLVQTLVEHKRKQEEWKSRLGGVYQDENLVICTDMGTLQDPRNVIRVFKRLSRSANVPEIRFHDLRHTHASILIAEGVDIVKVSKRLGHANSKITLEVYAHLLEEEDNEVADIFHNYRGKKVSVSKM